MQQKKYQQILLSSFYETSFTLDEWSSEHHLPLIEAIHFFKTNDVTLLLEDKSNNDISTRLAKALCYQQGIGGYSKDIQSAITTYRQALALLKTPSNGDLELTEAEMVWIKERIDKKTEKKLTLIKQNNQTPLEEDNADLASARATLKQSRIKLAEAEHNADIKSEAIHLKNTKNNVYYSYNAIATHMLSEFITYYDILSSTDVHPNNNNLKKQALAEFLVHLQKELGEFLKDPLTEKQHFLGALHSKDHDPHLGGDISFGRIIANLFLMLTVIGLLAIVINKSINDRWLFFPNTFEEKIDNLEKLAHEVVLKQSL